MEKRAFSVGQIIILLLLLLLLMIFIDLSLIISSLSKLTLQEYIIIKDYLSTLLSMPIIILIIVFAFFYKFSPSIKIFLENSRISQAGPIGISQHQTPTAPTEETVATEGGNGEATERVENFEFAYLNLALVLNTKFALMWFFIQSNHSSTKENFLNSYILSPEITNPTIEKESIFNALLVNQLIEHENGLYRITEKGKRFLRFLGYNIQI